MLISGCLAIHASFIDTWCTLYVMRVYFMLPARVVEDGAISCARLETPRRDNWFHLEVTLTR